MRKSILVTGASSGIGRALAVLMAKEGWAVALAARSREKLEETAALCRQVAPFADVLVCPGDIADPAQAARAVEAAHARFGRLDAVANVAGFAPMGALTSVSDATVRECLGVNLEAVIWTTRAAWPIFKAQKQGVVVNVSSMASADPFPGFNVYAAAKAGVNLFTLSTAKEGGSDGIRAYAVAPGCVETPMLRSLFDASAIPTEKCLTPESVAQVIADCVLGKRGEESGSVIFLPGP